MIANCHALPVFISFAVIKSTWLSFKKEFDTFEKLNSNAISKLVILSFLVLLTYFPAKVQNILGVIYYLKLFSIVCTGRFYFLNTRKELKVMKRI